MFLAQVTGLISSDVVQKEAKFGMMSSFSLDVKNRKGSVAGVSCYQFGESKVPLEKGVSVLISGDLDLSQFQGKTTVSLMVRHVEVLREAPKVEVTKQVQPILDMPFKAPEVPKEMPPPEYLEMPF
jgi:hypothetical protein